MERILSSPEGQQQLLLSTRACKKPCVDHSSLHQPPAASNLETATIRLLLRYKIQSYIVFIYSKVPLSNSNHNPFHKSKPFIYIFFSFLIYIYISFFFFFFFSYSFWGYTYPQNTVKYWCSDWLHFIQDLAFIICLIYAFSAALSNPALGINPINNLRAVDLQKNCC